MKTSVYKAAKLNIYEKFHDGVITESQRDELFTMLEAEKNETELTPKKIEDFMDELGEKYPDLEDEIEKLSDKICDADKCDDKEKEDPKDEDKGDSEDDIEESVRDMLNTLQALIED